MVQAPKWVQTLGSNQSADSWLQALTQINLPLHQANLALIVSLHYVPDRATPRSFAFAGGS
jgi:hypothetical protein